MELKKPSNTTADVNRNPAGFLLDSMVMGSSNAIEAQEARGQREFVNSDTLPTEMRPEYKAALEKIGFRFLGPVEGDELFQFVTMPVGWKKEPTDHAMWSNLVDSKGRIRGGIFYKAAFYDRKANLSLVVRYTARQDHKQSLDHNMAVAHVYDQTTIIFTTETLPTDERGGNRWDKGREVVAQAEKWLTEHFPEHADASAYWD